jgi:mRNA interferase RelE/StbE
LTYSIIWSKEAVKDLKKLDRPVARRIYIAIEQMSENPHHNVKKLVGSDLFRLRVGDFRVIFDIEEDRLRILVLKVGHRRSVYRC